jgi:hypothetical protein
VGVNLLFDMVDFIKLMKKTAVEAVNASKPADMVFGKVISIDPLKIKLDQKLILTAAHLVLSRNVTDYRLSVTKNSETELVTVHNTLQVGEEVILFQVAGGQKYIVIDRIGKG